MSQTTSDERVQMYRRIGKMPLLWRFIVLMLIVVVVPIYFMAMFGAHKGALGLERSYRGILLVRSEGLSYQVQTLLDRYRNDLEGALEDEYLQFRLMQMGQSEGADILATMRASAEVIATLCDSHPSIDSAYVFNADGELLHSRGSKRYADLESGFVGNIVEQAQNNERVWFMFAANDPVGSCGLWCALSIRDRTSAQKVLGVLLVRIGTDEIQQCVARNQGWTESSSEAEVMILTSQGQVVAHGTPRWCGATISGSPLVSPKTLKLPGVYAKIDHLREDKSAAVFETTDETDVSRMVGFSLINMHVTDLSDNWVATVRVNKGALSEGQSDLRDYLLQMGFLTSLVALAVSVWQGQRLTRPIRELIFGAERVAQGDLTQMVNIPGRDELAVLGAAYNRMVLYLRDHVRLQHELDAAQEIQRQLLPTKSPEIEGADIVGFNRPADKTGGDYYDFVETNEWAPGSLAVCIGDVSGHGTAAALLMSSARAHVRASLKRTRHLAEAMRHINEGIYEETPDNCFMTMGVLLIHSARRQVEWVLAGHDPILVLDPEKKRVGELRGEDILLGVDPSWEFDPHRSRALPEGSLLLLGTDGIWEARNPEGEMFGKSRLRRVLARCHDCDAATAVKRIVAAVDAFRGMEPQGDDITLVAVKLG